VELIGTGNWVLPWGSVVCNRRPTLIQRGNRELLSGKAWRVAMSPFSQAGGTICALPSDHLQPEILASAHNGGL